MQVRNLEPGTKYEFRVMAENSQGISDALETSEPILAKLPYGQFGFHIMECGYACVEWSGPAVGVFWRDCLCLYEIVCGYVCMVMVTLCTCMRLCVGMLVWLWWLCVHV